MYFPAYKLLNNKSALFTKKMFFGSINYGVVFLSSSMAEQPAVNR